MKLAMGEPGKGETFENLCAEFGLNPCSIDLPGIEVIRPENFTMDSLHRVTKDGQRCQVLLNNGDVLVTSSLYSIHMINDKPTGLGLDATGTFKTNSTQWPANMLEVAEQTITLPLASVRAIYLLDSDRNQTAPSLDKASF